jgi:hypothetical protein
MSRIISLTSKIAFIGLFIAAFCQPAFALDDGPKDISISTLMHRMSRADLVKLLGKDNLIDSSVAPSKNPSVDWHKYLKDSLLHPKNPNPETRPMFFKTLVFAPVQFEGFSTICEALIVDDSVMSFNLYLPYHAHTGAKPEAPYALHHFVNATLDDFNKVGDNIAKSLGLPSVSTETYIDYMVNGMQSVFGSLKGSNITISIYPRIGN